MNNIHNAKVEALNRLETLTKTFNLNPHIKQYFDDGELYYSYLTDGGFWGSIDTITYEAKYEQAVREFEDKTGYLVYHAIEAITPFGTMLSLLYVGPEDEWEFERLCGGDIIESYTINFDTGDEEFGSIGVCQYGESGALLRKL